MSKTVQTLNAKRESLLKQLEKVEREISQAGFVEQIAPGARVYGKLNDGSEFSSALVLGKTEAEGTSGVWYKLRLNEGTVSEGVKSVRLSNIEGVEGGDSAAEPEAPVAGGAGKASKKSEPAASEI